MKHLLVIALMLLVFTVPASGIYTTSEYSNESTQIGSLDPQFDPIWQIIESLGGAGGASGTGVNFYVDSGLSGGGATGKNWANATATLDAAINLTVAGRGDWIHVAEGHAETIAAANGWDADVAGITIYHHGSGSSQGTYTFSATASTVAVGAANVTIVGGRLLAGVSEVVIGLSVEATAHYLTVIGMTWPEPLITTYEFNIGVQLTSDVNDVSFLGCKASSATAGADHWLNGGAAAVQRLSVRGCTIYGNYAIAPIFSDQVDTETYIVRNEVQNLTTNQFAIEFSAAATGLVAYNALYTDAEATALDPGSMKCIENYVTTAVDKSGMIVPVHDTGTTQLNATTITAIANGINGVGFRGLAETNTDDNTIISDELSGFGNDYFNTDWEVIIIYDASGAGSAPEGEILDVNDYVSATGTFSVTPDPSAAITAGDLVFVRRVEELNLNDAMLGKSSGKIWYLDDSGATDVGGSSVGDGHSWVQAFATLTEAEAAMAAGDTLYIGANHSESINTGGDVLNLAGTSYIGMGTGDSRPLFTFDAAADELTLSAAGITLKNLRFCPGATDVVAGVVFGATGDGGLIEDCSFIDGAGADEEFRDCISVDTAAVGVTVRNCTYENSAATAADQDTFVNLDAATIANATVEGCTIFGTFAEAPIWGGAAIPTNINIRNNVISNTTTGQMSIEFQGAATGTITNNLLSGDTYGAILDPGSARCLGNMQTVGINAAAEDVPLVAGKRYARQMLLGDVGATQLLFSVTGSPIVIEHCWGIASVAIGGAATLNLEVDATSGHDYDFSTAVDIQSVDEGGSIVFTDVVAEGVTTPQALGSSGAGQSLSWFCEEGIFQSDSAGDTGNIEWYIIFTPVFSGGEVIPQAGNDA